MPQAMTPANEPDLINIGDLVNVKVHVADKITL